MTVVAQQEHRGVVVQWPGGCAEPKTVIQVGNRHSAVTAHFLTPDDGAEIMAGDAQRHPRTAQRLCTFMGLPSDGSEAGFREAGGSIPFVRLDADTDPRLA